MAEKQPNTAELPKARLYEDMHPLTYQIEVVSIAIAKAVGRLCGIEPVPFKFFELETYADMYKGIDQSEEVLDKVDQD